MSTNIFIDDECIDAQLTMAEGGPVECNDGTVGFSFFTQVIPIASEIILSEETLVEMLNEIRAEFGGQWELEE